MKLKVRIVNNLPVDQPPHSENSPICISKDPDMGWIIEKVIEGEYEVQNLPFIGDSNIDIDWELVNELSKEIPNGKVLMYCN